MFTVDRLHCNRRLILISTKVLAYSLSDDSLWKNSKFRLTLILPIELIFLKHYHQKDIVALKLRILFSAFYEKWRLQNMLFKGHLFLFKIIRAKVIKQLTLITKNLIKVSHTSSLVLDEVTRHWTFSW